MLLMSFRSIGFKKFVASLIIPVFALTACSTSKATIAEYKADAATGAAGNRTQVVAPEGTVVGDDAKIIAPKIKESERNLPRDMGIKDLWGWVRLRFDVSAEGKAANVRVVEENNKEVTEAAKKLIQTWSIEPGTLNGKPVEFRNVEATLSFESTSSESSSSDSAGMVILKVVGIIILVPIAIVLGLATGGGSMKFGN